LALVHHDSAVFVVRLRAFDDVLGGLGGLGAYFPGSASTLRGWAEEAAASRLYGGIHFRSDNETGLALGKKVAGVALTRYEPPQ
jgi:membrane-associated phospholipid phosphatase